MGGFSYDPDDWKAFASAKVTGKSTSTVFSSCGLKESLDPRKMKNMMRESVDDHVCPNSTAIMIGLDETGSMGIIPDYMVRTGFPKLFEEIYARKPVTDPHIMFLGIGDAERDVSPLQISQFEAGMRLAEQLTDIYLEGNGGGNHYEGYTLAWYVAAMHTKIDCFDKRNKKGYLFTVGDEEPTPMLYKNDLERLLGVKPQADLSARQLLDMASRMYHVYHVIVEEGSHARYYLNQVVSKWTDLLGQRTLRLADHTKLSEVIVSAIQQNEGDSVDAVVDSWKDPGTRAVVARAIGGMTAANTNNTGVVRL